MGLKRKQDLCIALLDDEEEVAKEKRARRRIWVKLWLQRRVELGIYSNLFQELLEARSLRDYIRMDKMHSDYLLERLHPKESKKKESKKNIFCREQKNSFCNIKCFKNF